MKWLIIIILLILLSGCIGGNDVHDYYKEGVVIEIEYDIIFGGTFTDWRNEITFEDGINLWIDKDSDLSDVRLNESGMYHFKTNFFDYDGSRYEFYDLIDVRYYDDLEIWKTLNLGDKYGWNKIKENICRYG